MGRGNSYGLAACVLFAVLGVVLALSCSFPAGARAEAQIITWDQDAVATSRFVDPSKNPGFNPPSGEAPSLKANVYLPDGYRPDGARRYPLLVLLAGSGDSYATWSQEDKGDLLTTLPDFPGIIVMPEGDTGWYSNWWNGGKLGDPAWERYHLDQLLPYVMKQLPIRPNRRWHAIGGNSMGGMGAMFYASQRPGFFGSAASFSGTLNIERPFYRATMAGDQPGLYGAPPEEFYYRGHNPLRLIEGLVHTRLYVATGDGSGPDAVLDPPGALLETELAQHSAEFNVAAQSAGASITYRPREGVHGWPPWRADLQRAIDDWGLFEKPPRPRGRWTYETVAMRGKMWTLKFRFAEQPQELIQFRRNGRTLEGRGSGEVTIRSGRRCVVALTLPFAQKLPRECWKRRPI